MVETSQLLAQQQSQQSQLLKQSGVIGANSFSSVKPSSDFLKDIDSIKQNFSFEDMIGRSLEYFVQGKFMPSKMMEAVVWDKAKGNYLYDMNGIEYVDGLSGLFNVPIGHGREEMADLVRQQLLKLDFGMSNAQGFFNTSAVLASQKLMEIVRNYFPNLKSVFWTNSGTEANETAAHIALRYWERLGKTDKTKFLSFNNCYHGATFFPQSINPSRTTYGWARFRSKRSEEFVFVDFPHELYLQSKPKSNETIGQAAARRLEETILASGKDSFAAFIFEPIQGDGGIVIPHDDFFPLARQICDRYGILMISDEVMTGFGRTGRFFCLDRWGVKPDMMTIAKGLSSAIIPCGGCVISYEIYDKVFNIAQMSQAFEHDFTTSGHPLAMAVVLKNLEIIERENLVENSRKMGSLLLERLRLKLNGLPVVKEVRGMGLFLGVELNSMKGLDICEDLVKIEHIMCHSSSNMHVITLAPCLTFTEKEVDRVVQGFYNVLSKRTADPVHDKSAAQNIFSKVSQAVGAAAAKVENKFAEIVEPNVSVDYHHIDKAQAKQAMEDVLKNEINK